MRPLHMLLALLTTMLWGFNFVVVKMGVGVVPPLFLTALRYIFSAFPLIFFIRRPSIGWTPLVSYGVAMGVGQFGLLFTSIQLGMPAGLASLVLQSQAFFTKGLAAMVIGEREIAAVIAPKLEDAGDESLTLVVAETLKTLIAEMLGNAGELSADGDTAMMLMATIA